MSRIEKDSLGPLEVPANAYYGAQTQRALLNFPISGAPMPRAFIVAHAFLKKAAAQVNLELGLLDEPRASAISQACREIIGEEEPNAGKAPPSPPRQPELQQNFAAHFPIDIYQTGSGTSTNMNLNEVIAARANEILGLGRATTPAAASPADKNKAVHPNDHVNLGQSSNDTIPTSLQVMAIMEITEQLQPAIHVLNLELHKKVEEFWPVIKTGRTHLQDATPIRLGQEFLGYAGQMERALTRLDFAVDELAQVPLGGTAVGTGINAHPQYAPRVCGILSKWLEVTIHESDNHFQAQATLDTAVSAHAILKTIAVSLTKIANDIRWMGSGPRAGLGEIEIPTVQPGSSIMPGKVNPVIAESLLMVCQRVVGNDAALTAAAMQNNFELAMSIPLAAACLHESITLLATASLNFATQCVKGLKATKRGPELVEQGLMLATALAPKLGYEKAAAIAKEAAASARTIRQVAREKGGIGEEELVQLLNVEGMVGNNEREMG